MRLQGYMEKRALHFIDPEVQDMGLRLTQELVTILYTLKLKPRLPCFLGMHSNAAGCSRVSFCKNVIVWGISWNDLLQQCVKQIFQMAKFDFGNFKK